MTANTAATTAKKNKKGAKMSLNAFLADESTGSWADEMSDLPTMTSAVYEQAINGTSDDSPSTTRGGFQGGRPQTERPDRPWRNDGGRGGARRDQPQREVKEIPDQPPYTAYIGGLPYSATQDSLGAIFTPHVCTNVRIPVDRDSGKVKGFAYVEFTTREGLQYALDKINSGDLIMDGRKMRADVADAPKREGSGKFTPQRDDSRDFSEWRRDTPLQPTPSASQRQSSFSSSAGGFSSRSASRGRDRPTPPTSSSRFSNDTEWKGGAFSKPASAGGSDSRPQSRQPPRNDRSPSSHTPSRAPASGGNRPPVREERPFDNNWRRAGDAPAPVVSSASRQHSRPSTSGAASKPGFESRAPPARREDPKVADLEAKLRKARLGQ
ncbi:hypothetical protein MIR68_003036 [Amoeboaphelidium protococcarum]|nr:hypothetical protein MIR68_003036 [Amoeboaphelidium protococcarum]